jgi:hypothetical protein
VVHTPRAYEVPLFVDAGHDDALFAPASRANAAADDDLAVLSQIVVGVA